ncbi:putative Nuclear receptor subfamily 1 group D member 1 [Hypsibius exemplaris]|uniref:Nuclear receptor subfamily 1 group D member 1 n=1 Tax=Hypsibius exemplaris TaxID=2072580 RepID=A0A1W0WCQ4_HYPEX|nr:putative Nuclear receptor subfamily 1 group D member 1 [Hypsibius exemplaris]
MQMGSLESEHNRMTPEQSAGHWIALSSAASAVGGGGVGGDSPSAAAVAAAAVVVPDSPMKVHLDGRRASQPIKFPFTDSLCRVCRSLSTGVHYGVSTCEGCKGFFKRSIPKCQHYKCYFGGDCEITKESRNRCKSCRFQRCLQVGMALEAVKMGRIPKGERERAQKTTDIVQNSGCHRMKSLKILAPSPSSYAISTTPTLCPPSMNSTFAASEQQPSRSPDRPHSGTALISPPSYNDAFYQSPPPSSSSSSFSSSGAKRMKIAPTLDSFSDRTSLLSTDIPRRYSADAVNSFPFRGLSKTSPSLSSVPEDDLCCTATTIDSHRPHHPSHRLFPPRSSNSGRRHSDFIPTASHHQRAPLFMSSLSMPVSSRTAHLSTGSSPSTPSLYSNSLRGVAGGGRGQDVDGFGRSVSLNDAFPPLLLSSNTVASRDTFSPACSSVFSDRSRQPNNCSARDSGVGSSSRSTSVTTTVCSDGDFLTPGSRDGGIVTGDPFFGGDFDATDSGSWLDFGNETSDGPGGPEENCTVQPPIETLADTGKWDMLENMLETIDRAGNDVYREESSEAVEFMVRMWQEGRLTPDAPTDSNVTVLKIRDRIKESLGNIVKNILTFLDRIPGFSVLRKSDVSILVEKSIFDMWMVQNSAFLVNNESYIMLQLPGVDRPFHYTRFWMANFLSEPMINAMMEFADEQNSCHLTFSETNILKAIVVLSPDRQGLEDPTSVGKLRRTLQEALEHAFLRRLPTSAAEEMRQKVHSLMFHLERLSQLYFTHITPVDMNKEPG